jgi:hypothetical protein
VKHDNTATPIATTKAGNTEHKHHEQQRAQTPGRPGRRRRRHVLDAWLEELGYSSQGMMPMSILPDLCVGVSGRGREDDDDDEDDDCSDTTGGAEPRGSGGVRQQMRRPEPSPSTTRGRPGIPVVPRNETNKDKDPHLKPPAPKTPTRSPIVSSFSTSKQKLIRTPINCTNKHIARHTAEQPHARTANNKTASTNNSTVKRATAARKKHSTRSRQQKQKHGWNYNSDCDYAVELYTVTWEGEFLVELCDSVTLRQCLLMNGGATVQKQRRGDVHFSLFRNTPGLSCIHA